MSALSQHRCLNHAAREAAARCPECRSFFCRECVTEHEGRALCSACLARLTQVIGPQPWRLGWLVAPSTTIAGVLVAWLFFYGVGHVLLSIPDDWHEGTVWQKLVPD